MPRTDVAGRGLLEQSVNRRQALKGIGGLALSGSAIVACTDPAASGTDAGAQGSGGATGNGGAASTGTGGSVIGGSGGMGMGGGDGSGGAVTGTGGAAAGSALDGSSPGAGC